MTTPKQATENGLEAHYKVRVVLPGAILHLASWTEPRIHRSPVAGPHVQVDAEWIADPDYGDTIGFIEWNHVVAVTWRHAR